MQKRITPRPHRQVGLVVERHYRQYRPYNQHRAHGAQDHPLVVIGLPGEARRHQAGHQQERLHGPPADGKSQLGQNHSQGQGQGEQLHHQMERGFRRGGLDHGHRRRGDQYAHQRNQKRVVRVAGRPGHQLGYPRIGQPPLAQILEVVDDRGQPNVVSDQQYHRQGK